jgi:hypothetical protein
MGFFSVMPKVKGSNLHYLVHLQMRLKSLKLGVALPKPEKDRYVDKVLHGRDGQMDGPMKEQMKNRILNTLTHRTGTIVWNFIFKK